MTDELLLHIVEETNRFVDLMCICIATMANVRNPGTSFRRQCLGARFKAVYRPGQNISIDKSLWKFRGRLSFRTYTPSKRVRFGVKVYKLSASDGLGAGYTSVFQI